LHTSLLAKGWSGLLPQFIPYWQEIIGIAHFIIAYSAAMIHYPEGSKKRHAMHLRLLCVHVFGLHEASWHCLPQEKQDLV